MCNMNVCMNGYICMYVCYICCATRMEEPPKVTLDIQCLWQGGGVALTSTIN